MNGYSYIILPFDNITVNNVLEFSDNLVYFGSSNIRFSFKFAYNFTTINSNLSDFSKFQSQYLEYTFIVFNDN